MPSEFIPIFESLGHCLDLRDKYMARSGQKLGFNPRDHDGVFSGLDDDISTVSGVRPDADFASRPPPKSPFKRWRIYPRPPAPHWHWHTRDQDNAVPHHAGEDPLEDEEFDFSMCEIPGPHKWDFSIDEKGVYQVYNGEGTCMSLWLCVICGVDLRQIATTMRFLA